MSYALGPLWCLMSTLRREQSVPCILDMPGHLSTLPSTLSTPSAQPYTLAASAGEHVLAA